MKIIIGADGNQIESLVAKRFGHANYFILFNTETKTYTPFDNIDKGNNHYNLQNFLDQGVEAFIVGNIGPHAFEIVNTSKCKVYLARKMSVREVIEKFINSELKQLNEPTTKKSIGSGNQEELNH